jgi:hypothetical protein
MPPYDKHYLSLLACSCDMSLPEYYIRNSVGIMYVVCIISLSIYMLEIKCGQETAVLIYNQLHMHAWEAVGVRECGRQYVYWRPMDDLLLPNSVFNRFYFIHYRNQLF